MSRCVVKAKDPDHTVVVGLNHGHLPWFIQVFKGEEDIPFHDRDYRSKMHLVQDMNKYCVMTDWYTRSVADAIAMDVDPKMIPTR